MIISMAAFITLTILVYLGATRFYRKYPFPVFIPISTSTIVLVLFLFITHIPYSTYMIGGKWIDGLLGPAVVSLAYPLYYNRQILKKYLLPILIGNVGGALIGMTSGLYLSILFQIHEKIILSIIPKSVTTPVAMDVTRMIGGNPSLAAVFVVFAGMFGAIFGPYFLKKCHITHFIGVGIGFGAASHGIGTAKALEVGKREGAISSVSMTLSAIITAMVCPFLVHFFL